MPRKQNRLLALPPGGKGALGTRFSPLRKGGQLEERPGGFPSRSASRVLVMATTRQSALAEPLARRGAHSAAGTEVQSGHPTRSVPSAG